MSKAIAQQKMSGYSLYQTFKTNPPPTKDITAAQKKYIVKATTQMTNTQLVAFTRLIVEHARLDNFDFETGDTMYGCLETEEGMEFSLDEIPKELRWILYKFCAMCMKKE